MHVWHSLLWAAVDPANGLKPASNTVFSCQKQNKLLLHAPGNSPAADCKAWPNMVHRGGAAVGEADVMAKCIGAI